jgi:hypothetical protein
MNNPATKRRPAPGEVSGSSKFLTDRTQYPKIQTFRQDSIQHSEAFDDHSEMGLFFSGKSAPHRTGEPQMIGDIVNRILPGILPEYGTDDGGKFF